MPASAANAERRRRYAEDPEYRAQQQERSRRYHAEHREQKRALDRQRYETDTAYREGRRKYGREWYTARREAPGFREDRNARATDRRNADPELHRERNRLAQQRRRVDRDLPAEYQKALRRDPCAYCSAPCEHLDHIEPIASGGANSWTNLTAACGLCNSTKKDKPLLTFLLEQAA